MPFAPLPATSSDPTVLPFDRKRFAVACVRPIMSGGKDVVALAIGRRMRLRRRQLGETLTEIGRRAGVSYQQVQRFECGETQISAAMVWKLAAALGVSIHYLFGEPRDPGQAPSERPHGSPPPAPR